MARPAYSEIENGEIRDRIASDALALFREEGADGVSLRKLAKQMGVSHTLLYRYFENKEALFTEIRLASLRVFYTMLVDADNEEDPIADRLKAAAYGLIQYGQRNSREYRFLFSEDQPDLESNDPLLALRHKVFNHMVGLAEEAFDQGVLKIEARTWVHLAWATLHGMLTLNENHQLLEGRSFESLVESAVGMLLPASD